MSNRAHSVVQRQENEDRLSQEQLDQERQIERMLVQLDEAGRRLFRRITTDLGEYPFSIPPAQLFMLSMLDSLGPHRMTDLATRLDVTQSGCTALVDRAIQAGLVVRRRDAADRRVVWVELTTAGNRTLDEIRHMRAKILARYLNRLRPDEIQQLATLIGRVAEVVLDEDSTVTRQENTL